MLVALFKLGFLVCVAWLCSVYYRFFLSKDVNMKTKYGEWALITGATDGIGKAYAMELAKRGLNIVLLSRSIDRLKTTAADIEAKHGVKTEIIALDLGTASQKEIEDAISQKTKGLDVGTLINNAGISYEFPCYLDELPNDRIDTLLQLNIAALIYITKALLPRFQAKKTGCIINISSSSGMVPTPLLTVYAATKSFVDFFSRGIHSEYAKDNIFVQSVMPSFVCTKLSKMKRPSYSMPTPDTFVRFALKTVGYDRRTTGYWYHEIQENFLLYVIPSRFYEFVRLKSLEPLRRRALKNASKTTQ